MQKKIKNKLEKQREKLAAPALIFTGGGFLLTFLGGISSVFSSLGLLIILAGLVLGIISLSRIKDNPELKGKGMALTAVIVGAIWFGLLTIALLTYI